MFDELEKKTETDDMFAETDSAAPQVAAPTQSSPVTSQVSVSETPSVSNQSPMQQRIDSLASKKHAFPWKVIVLFVAIIAVIVIAFFLSMRILKSKTPLTPFSPDISSESASSAENVPEATVPSEDVSETPPIANVPAVDATLDSDKDGLMDAREAQLGTNPSRPDTDADGLFDREEVDVYRTNPLNPDTDDSFKDGDEVKKAIIQTDQENCS